MQCSGWPCDQALASTELSNDPYVRSPYAAPVRRGQRVGVLIPAVSRVRGDPAQRQLFAALHNLIELLHQFQILDRPSFALPPAGFHAAAHSLMVFTHSSLSVYITAVMPSGTNLHPAINAISSMRLLVV